MPETQTDLAASRPLWRTFLVFLGPLVLTNMLQALSGTLNNIYVGQMLGIKALAAVAGFFPLLLLFISFVIGFGAGASVLVGQAWGAKDIPQVRAIAGTVLYAGFLLGVVIGLGGMLLTEPMLLLLGTPADVLPQSVAYARIMLAALPLLFVSMLAAAVLRGVGDTVTPLFALGVSSAIILVLTPALIRGWAGLPALGITGGAWATLIASAASLLWLGFHLRRRGRPLAPDVAFWRQLYLSPDVLKPVIRLGFPTGLFFITGSLADLALLRLVNSYGSHATAAWGAVSQVMAYVQFPAMSIAIAASVLAAQAIGAGRLQQLDQVTRIGLAMNIVLTGALAVLVLVFARTIVGLFITDPEVLALAASLLHITVWASLIFGLASVFTAVMRASGTVLVPTLISLGCLGLLLFPLGWAFSAAFGLPGIWASYPATYAVALLLQAAYFYGVWKKKPIRKLV
ncbi:MAG: MATE family efflux transporter [Polaromonas sp.]|uniref:MATE family efflux transporter n=1 Tax=Polaromonas sp. TaxID=1869339 RepID=UPI00179D3AC7|nr:MATE family efflux transporter [Polaromonas sp.]MBA3595698.1 MATE family efflux transporter [Polaromonas sp.]